MPDTGGTATQRRPGGGGNMMNSMGESIPSVVQAPASLHVNSQNSATSPHDSNSETPHTHPARRSSSSAPAAASTGQSAQMARGGLVSPLNLLPRLIALLTILIRVALWPVGRLVFLAFPPKEFDGINSPAAAERAARAFVSMFRSHLSELRPAATNPSNQREREQYVEPECPFTPRGYAATLSEIRSLAPRSPLLLIYLHSPLHRDGTSFIRNVLCQSHMLNLFNGQPENVICFGASVHSADGAHVRDVMGVTSFPFLALVSVKSNGAANNVALELLLRMSGPALLTLPPPQLKTYLTNAIARHAEVLAQAELRRLQREEETRLREEQDREYQEALLADQIREIQQREAAEEARRAEEEREELERRRVERESKRLEDSHARLRESEEPAAGSAGSARLRFTLPNGKKIDRRFRSSDTLEVLHAFLVVYFHEHGIEIKNFAMSTSFPKKSFKEEELSLTIDDAGLAPQAVVMVQDLDA